VAANRFSRGLIVLALCIACQPVDAPIGPTPALAPLAPPAAASTSPWAPVENEPEVTAAKASDAGLDAATDAGETDPDAVLDGELAVTESRFRALKQAAREKLLRDCFAVSLESNCRPIFSALLDATDAEPGKRRLVQLNEKLRDADIVMRDGAHTRHLRRSVPEYDMLYCCDGTGHAGCECTAGCCDGHGGVCACGR
jgi:hypothetical protein